MWKTALTSRELYHDLNEKRESTRIRQFKNSLRGNMVIEGLEKNTSSIKIHVKSFKMLVRSCSEVFQILRVILCFRLSSDSLYFCYCSFFFSLFFLHLCFLHLSFLSQMAYSSPQKTFWLPSSHLSNSFLKPISSGNFHFLSKPDAFLALNTFSISFLVCLKACISGSRGLSVIFFPWNRMRIPYKFTILTEIA